MRQREGNSTHNRLEMQPFINQDIIRRWFRRLWWWRIVELDFGVAPEAHCVSDAGKSYVLEANVVINLNSMDREVTMISD